MSTSFSARALRPSLGAALVAAVALLGGCSTYQVPKYAVSVDNAKVFKASAVKVNVASFTAGQEGSETSVRCRMVGPIQTPTGETFAAYVQKALVDELTIAERYDAAAPIEVKGNLSHLGFISLGTGEWQLTLDVTVGQEKTFTLQRSYKFETAFVAEKACALSAQAFLPAVQDLMNALASDPTFQKAVSKPTAAVKAAPPKV